MHALYIFFYSGTLLTPLFCFDVAPCSLIYKLTTQGHCLRFLRVPLFCTTAAAQMSGFPSNAFILWIVFWGREVD